MTPDPVLALAASWRAADRAAARAQAVLDRAEARRPRRRRAALLGLEIVAAAAWRQWNAIADQIIATPARTPAGVLLKLRIVLAIEGRYARPSVLDQAPTEVQLVASAARDLAGLASPPAA